MTLLNTLGFAEFESGFQAVAEADMLPGRVAQTFAKTVELWTEEGLKRAHVRSAVYRDSGGLLVGDWVAYQKTGDTLRVERLVERKTMVARKAPGKRAGVQGLVANVDTIVIVTAAGEDFSPRRLERTLSLVWESGAAPVIAINKADTTDDIESLEEAVEEVAMGVPYAHLSALEGTGVEELLALIPKGQTLALIGSSGVGKSTLVNCIAGEELASTREVRASDETGKHTTTGRCLLPIRDWVIIDTPGLREVGLADAATGIDTVFAEIVALAEDCKFRDCQHDREPGCAVRAAVEDGNLAEDRLTAFQSLQREERSATARLDVHTHRAAERSLGKRIKQVVAQKKHDRGD